MTYIPTVVLKVWRFQVQALSTHFHLYVGIQVIAVLATTVLASLAGFAVLDPSLSRCGIMLVMSPSIYYL